MFLLQRFLVNQTNEMIAGFYSNQRLRHLTVSWLRGYLIPFATILERKACVKSRSSELLKVSVNAKTSAISAARRSLSWGSASMSAWTSVFLLQRRSYKISEASTLKATAMSYVSLYLSQPRAVRKTIIVFLDQRLMYWDRFFAWCPQMLVLK